MPEELCLLCVHAHPDDESSKGAATVAKYHAEGVRSVLVCCTGGEEGEILNPAMNKPEVIDRLAEVRAQELADAARIIGYDEVVMLGYRDSGMAGSEANTRAGSFAQAPLDEATARLVGVIRRNRPQVMAIYPANQWYYPHPDHIKAHDVGMAAFHAAADPSLIPEAGPPWQVLKLYYMMFSRRRMAAIAAKFLELGIEVPWHRDENVEDKDGPTGEAPGEPLTTARAGALSEAQAGVLSEAQAGVLDEASPEPRVSALDEALAEAPPEEEVTTEVDVSGFGHVRDDALRAHATQVDPNSPFWFGLPDEAAAELGYLDEYHLAHNLTTSQPPEDDLFGGIRERAVL